MITTELLLLIFAVLLGVSILASKVSDRFGVPALLLFLAIGMLAGSDGPGGIYFDDAAVAQGIGVVALVIILFSGGLDTDWETIRPVLRPGLALALVGVLVTAVVVGAGARYLLGVSWLEGLLLGAIVSSTDAAAVFSILRARGINLKGRLQPLLELESGSNDPMAVFLTLGLIQLIVQPGFSPLQLVPRFFVQMGVGALVGVGMGWLAVRLINRIRLSFDGLYPVLAVALALFTYGLAGVLGGSGFLAIYLAGVTLGNAEFIHRRSLLRFFDGLAWLMQIAMFLTLGLLVFPAQLPGVVVPGMLIAGVLMLVARPLGVFASLLFSRWTIREQVFVGWVGLRGAAPIILATFPLLAGVANADALFNLVFFVVLTSVLIQGPSIPLAARWLRVDAPAQPRRAYPVEPGPEVSPRSSLRELAVPDGSSFAGRRIVELGLPPEFLVVLIDRDGEFLIPSGGAEIRSGDRLLVLSDEEAFQVVKGELEPGDPGEGRGDL